MPKRKTLTNAECSRIALMFVASMAQQAEVAEAFSDSGLSESEAAAIQKRLAHIAQQLSPEGAQLYSTAQMVQAVLADRK